MPPRRTPLALGLSSVLAAGLAVASPAPQEAADAPEEPEAHHDQAVDLDRVVVRASPLARTADDLARPVEVLAGAKLDEARAASLGDTVDGLPGVQSSYFGPGVGRPIIRGMDGARVQVLSDGLGSGDVSTVSADHAVTIEPFLADQIEVLKGPATLLYGSGAIGGAVNVIDGRVPVEKTDEPIQGRAEVRAGTVDDGRTAMARLDATSGDVVLHFDALHRETGDYAIPGHAESALAHDDGHEDEGDHDEDGELGAEGTLPGSAIRTDSAAIGASWIGERGFIGAAYSLFSSRYGVPGHAHEDEHEDEHEDAHEDGHEEDAHGDESVRIVMDQRRTEVRGGLDELGPFDTLRIKLANTGYTHTEFEGGAVGTVFDNDALEGRLELVHRPLAGWNGAFGVQWGKRDFVAVGEEAFVPGSRAHDAGVFWIGERELHERVTLELGARHDRNRIAVDLDAPDRDFETFSASAAARWDVNEDLHVSVGLDRAQRAPTAEELYSDGVHVATQSVEQGDVDLDVETANRAEVGLHWHGSRLRVDAALYTVRFDDFIYLAETGAEVEGLPVRQWTQADARFTGMEAEAELMLLDNASGTWDLRVFGDRVQAALDDGGNLPRIAPARVGGEVRWARGQWRASLGATRTLRQDDVAPGESPTPGYTLVDAHVAWHHDTDGGNAWEVFVDGSNLLDAEARPHTSFLKDLAPLPGRGIAFGVRAFF